MPGSANANGSGGERARMVQGCEHRLYRDGQGPRIEETLPVLRAPHAGMRCPVEAALQVLDDRWKTLIVWRLFWGAKPFCELMRCTRGLTKKTLRHALAEMERHGLVARQVRFSGSRKAEYALTPYGETLKPIVGAMYEWGLQHASVLPSGIAPS